MTTYTGTHAICHQTSDSLRAQFTEALVAEREKLAADYLIAQHIRWMCLPGQKRKTIRVDELRHALDIADAKAQASA